MKYNLLYFQTSGRFIIFFNKHDYQVSASLMKQNKGYKRLKTAKWISIRELVPGLLLTVRSAGYYVCCWLLCYFSSLAVITFSVAEINPAMLRPIMLQNSHFAMAPPTNTPTGEFVPNMSAMPTGQYDPSQNFPDPNTGMVYPPQQ